MGTGCRINRSKKTVRIYHLHSRTRSSTNLLLCFWSTLCVVRSFTTPLHHHLVFHLPPGSVGNERRRKEEEEQSLLLLPKSESPSWGGVGLRSWARRGEKTITHQSFNPSSSLPPSFLLSNLQFLATKTMGGDGGGGGDGHRRRKFSLRLPILRLYNPVYRFAAVAATISKKRLLNSSPLLFQYLPSSL